MRIDLNKRQLEIIKVLQKYEVIVASEILSNLKSKGFQASRATLNRDLEELVDIKYLLKIGSGPATRYELTNLAKINTYINPDEYFDTEIDARNANLEFNWSIFDSLSETQIFLEGELEYLQALNKEFQENRQKLSETIIKKEIERVTIELSWKSSQIEGNTYTLLETEELIKSNQKAVGKSEDESRMILNHKNAIDYIFKNSDDFEKVDSSKIINLHSILIENLGVNTGIRKSLVGITGTNYKPIDNQHQINDALDKLCDLINSTDNIFKKSLISIFLLSYIQPFEDGNKRTSRILGNAILLANGSFPLSFRSVEDIDYKKAMLLFYEQNNLSFFKEIFLSQAEFSVQNYFRYRS